MSLTLGCRVCGTLHQALGTGQILSIDMNACEVLSEVISG